MAWRELHHNFIVGHQLVDNDDGTGYFRTHHNFLVNGFEDGFGWDVPALKSDWGGHDNHHFSNIDARVQVALHIGSTLPGHEDYFYDNKVVLISGNSSGELPCSDPQPQLHDNQYFTVDGTLTVCDKSLADIQKEGLENASTVAKTPSVDTIMGWAAALLNIRPQEMMV